MGNATHMAAALLALLPADWTAADAYDGRYTTLVKPQIGGITIDWEQRTFRFGWVWSGKRATDAVYKGRGWQTKLVRDAVARLGAL